MFSCSSGFARGTGAGRSSRGRGEKDPLRAARGGLTGGWRRDSRRVRSLGRCARGRAHLPEGAIQLAGDLDPGRLITADDLGMQQGEGRREGERQAANQGDRRQAAVRYGLALAGRGQPVGPVFAGMQEAMFEGPMLGEVVPVVSNPSLRFPPSGMPRP